MTEMSDSGESGRPGTEEGSDRREAGKEAEARSRPPGSESDRLQSLLEEFRRRQRQRPDLAVRPWWTSGGGESGGGEGSRIVAGFVVEYCPRGVDSVEIAVRPDRVRVEGSGGLRESSLDLGAGWYLDGADVRCPELMANHLLSMADRLLGEAA